MKSLTWLRGELIDCRVCTFKHTNVCDSEKEHFILKTCNNNRIAAAVILQYIH